MGSSGHKNRREKSSGRRPDEEQVNPAVPEGAGDQPSYVTGAQYPNAAQPQPSVFISPQQGSALVLPHRNAGPPVPMSGNNGGGVEWSGPAGNYPGHGLSGTASSWAPATQEASEISASQVNGIVEQPNFLSYVGDGFVQSPQIIPAGIAGQSTPSLSRNAALGYTRSEYGTGRAYAGGPARGESSSSQSDDSMDANASVQ